jgi:hypothetical protein
MLFEWALFVLQIQSYFVSKNLIMNFYFILKQTYLIINKLIAYFHDLFFIVIF